MRRIARLPLDPKTAKHLQNKQAQVDTSSSPVPEAKRLWDQKAEGVFGRVRTVLEEMASGRARCMYCEDSLGTDIEHFWPKRSYPERAFVWENYLLACSHCNSNDKRTQFPVDATGAPMLIDPTDLNDDPLLHFEFLPSTGELRPVTPKGIESAKVFGLNDPKSPRRLRNGRRDAYKGILRLLREYDAVAADPERGEDLRAELHDYPFSGVLAWLLWTARQPGATDVLPSDILRILDQHAVAAW